MDHTGSLIKALALIVVVFIAMFGLRPAIRMLVEAKGPEPAQNPQLPDNASTPGVHQAATTAAKVAREQSPNLIADLTSKLGRTPQKRLEQMIDFDEEQAAAILKQWMRGARSA